MFVQLASAQDKIITTSGDTILCRIVTVANNHIVYEQQADKKQISGKMILLGDVAEYFRAPAKQSSNEIYVLRPPEQPWLLSVSVGGAYLPWLLENIEDEYAESSDYKKLDNGFALNASIHYLITQHIGFGVHYSFFTSGYKNNYPTVVEPSYPIYSNSTNRERQYINYAGISVIFRQFLDRNQKISLNETLGGGLLLYRNESQSRIYSPYYSYPSYSIPSYHSPFQDISQNILITGNTFGANVGISAEYKILPYMSVGIGGNFMYGKLSEVNVEYKTSMVGSKKSTNVKLENPLKMSRIDYSFVVRFDL